MFSLSVLFIYLASVPWAKGAIVQAPKAASSKTINQGFGPDDTPKIELCHKKIRVPVLPPNSQGFLLDPDSCFSGEGRAVKEKGDLVFELEELQAFVKKMGHGKPNGLDPFGFGLSVQRKDQSPINRFMVDREPVFKKTQTKIANESQVSWLKDLPLVEVPSTYGDRKHRRFAFLVSGDGGWTSMNQDLASALAQQGVSVIGLDSLRYFWNARSPIEFSNDLAQILSYYQAKWQTEDFLLLGYSFGGDVLPAVAARLPLSLSRATRAISLISPSEFASFEIKALEWLDLTVNRMNPVRNEIAHLDERKLICFFGNQDKTALCPLLEGAAKVIHFDVGHRMNDHAKDIANFLIQEIYDVEEGPNR